MIKMFFIFLILSVSSSVFAASVNDKTELSIQIQAKDVQINLPHEAYEALKKWNSDFTVFDPEDFSPSVLELFVEGKTVPMAFIGDLDGSGKNGIVLLGDDSKSQFVIALVPGKKEWEVIQVYSASIPDVKKSEVPTLSEVQEVGVPFYVLPALGEHAKQLQLKKKIGIQIEAYLGFSEVYQIKDGKAEKFVLSRDPSEVKKKK